MGCGCGGTAWEPPTSAGLMAPVGEATGPNAPGYYHTAGEEMATVVSDQGRSVRVPVVRFPPPGTPATP